LVKPYRKLFVSLFNFSVNKIFFASVCLVSVFLNNLSNSPIECRFVLRATGHGLAMWRHLKIVSQKPLLTKVTKDEDNDRS
jgi:hypothetical protein